MFSLSTCSIIVVDHSIILLLLYSIYELQYKLQPKHMLENYVFFFLRNLAQGLVLKVSLILATF